MTWSKPTSPVVAEAATWLFVPGDRPERLDKAFAAGAHQVILDLEDAVAPQSKASARRHVREFLAQGGTGYVRINASGTPWHDDDMAALLGQPTLAGIVLPKADSVEVLRNVAHVVPGVELIALVESAAGVLAAPEIAASGLVGRLALGSLDLGVDLNAPVTDELLLGPRMQLVLASRAVGLPGPLDGVTPAIDNHDRISRDSRTARGLGFAGKLCIHPRQLHPVAEAFAPSAEEIQWAREVLDALEAQARAGASTAAFTLGASMVDGPVIAQARALLANESRRDGDR